MGSCESGAAGKDSSTSASPGSVQPLQLAKRGALKRRTADKGVSDGALEQQGASGAGSKGGRRKRGKTKQQSGERAQPSARLSADRHAAPAAGEEDETTRVYAHAALPAGGASGQARQEADSRGEEEADMCLVPSTYPSADDADGVADPVQPEQAQPSPAMQPPQGRSERAAMPQPGQQARQEVPGRGSGNRQGGLKRAGEQAGAPSRSERRISWLRPAGGGLGEQLEKSGLNRRSKEAAPDAVITFHRKGTAAPQPAAAGRRSERLGNAAGSRQPEDCASVLKQPAEEAPGGARQGKWASAWIAEVAEIAGVAGDSSKNAAPEGACMGPPDAPHAAGGSSREYSAQLRTKQLPKAGRAAKANQLQALLGKSDLASASEPPQWSRQPQRPKRKAEQDGPSSAQAEHPGADLQPQPAADASQDDGKAPGPAAVSAQREGTQSRSQPAADESRDCSAQCPSEEACADLPCQRAANAAAKDKVVTSRLFVQHGQRCNGTSGGRV